MKTYEIWYKVNVSKMAYIEANSLEEAETKAETMVCVIFNSRNNKK